MNPTSTVLDMNNINTIYINLLEESNCESIQPNCKTYLKQLIKDNIAQVEFIKPNRKNCPEKLCSISEKDRIVDSVLGSTTDIYNQIYETAMLIRNNEKEQKPWKFQGSFENYQEPDMLHALIKWIITGPKTTLNSEKRQHYLDRTVNNVTQIISRSIKSDRQIKYSSTSSKSATFHETKETPFSVGLGLLMYKHTRSKKIINILSDMKLAINYDKVLKIETNIAEYVVKTMEECAGVYVSPSLEKHSLVYFATDAISKMIHQVENRNSMAQYKLFIRIR